jgi:hypothetical protein
MSARRDHDIDAMHGANQCPGGPAGPPIREATGAGAPAPALTPAPGRARDRCTCEREGGMVLGTGVWRDGVLHTTSGCRPEKDGWGERCPNCPARFPVLHGPHPTWVPCRPEKTDQEADRG